MLLFFKINFEFIPPEVEITAKFVCYVLSENEFEWMRKCATDCSLIMYKNVIYGINLFDKQSSIITV